jgi:amino acid transporter
VPFAADHQAANAGGHGQAHDGGPPGAEQGTGSSRSPARGADLAHAEEITSLEGIPALSLDAISSVAYGPEAMLVVLASAGAGALDKIEPITGAIVLLLVIFVFSYRQVIQAYPDGGGCYAVSKGNLGRPASLLAGAALIVDYVLTVAVSIAAGVAALISAFPSLAPDALPISLGILGLLTALNLRGLATSARALLLPTAVFIIGIYVVIGAGFLRSHPASGAAV